MLPIPTTDPTPTLAAYAETWLATIRGAVREHSRERYRYRLERYVLPALGAFTLTTLSRRHVRDCLAALASRGLAPHTVRAAHAVLHALLNLAIDDELVGTNVAARLARKLHQATRPRPALDVRQLDLFLETAYAVDPASFPLFVAMAAGGLRVGEAIGLRPEDVSATDPVVAVRRTIRSGGLVGPTKSGKGRAVRVTETAARILRGVPVGASGWLFPARKGPKPISYTRVKKLTRRIAATAGLPVISPKAFRRSYAVAMHQHGASLAWLAAQFGHANEKTTAQFYTDGAVPPVPDLFGH